METSFTVWILTLLAFAGAGYLTGYLNGKDKGFMEGYRRGRSQGEAIAKIHNEHR